MVFVQVSTACAAKTSKTCWPSAVRLLSTQQRCWQVSSKGRCCNLRGVISEGHAHPSGYRNVTISGHLFKVHRLVAFAFLGPPPSEAAWQVHHRDGNPSNNHLDNLEYVTSSQNMLHSYANPSRRTSASYHSKPVLWRAVGSQSWTTSPSITHAAERVGMATKSISKACRLEKQAQGFEFKLAHSGASATLVGEQWRQMYDPMSGAAVAGRMVSSFGRIQSQAGTISRGYQTREGYFRTQMSLHLQKRSELVHRLVAFAFLRPPTNRECNQVNHKDCNKRNNAVENLEYVTAADNIVHRYANSMPACRLMSGKVVESRLCGSNDEWQWYPSMKSAARILQVNVGGISLCVKGTIRHTGGYEFRLASQQTKEVYADEEWCDVDIEAHLVDRASRKLTQPLSR